nr:ATP-binding protein [Sneathiella glossodoripedis]
MNSAGGRTGKLNIDISNQIVDDDMAENHEDIVAGEYVMLSIADNGTGIPAEILDRIFEPFSPRNRLAKARA